MSESPNSSGIFSLSGFAYQIRVLAYCSSRLSPNEQIEFETIDDVAINRNDVHLSLDKNSTSFSNLVGHGSVYDSIQVKRTGITNGVKVKILHNWFITEIWYGSKIDKYILIAESDDITNSELFSISEQKMYDQIIQSDKNANALITKLKEKIENDFENFERIYNSVKRKYVNQQMQNIDELIISSFKSIFRSSAINESTYKLRVREYVNQITYEIIDAIFGRKPYLLSYSNFEKIVEKICSTIQDEKSEIDYSVFKKVNRQSLIDTSIASSREYRQLAACGLSENIIETYLMQNEYYKASRLSFMSTSRSDCVRNIEETAFENFEIIKEDLQIKDLDSPYNRMSGTTNKDNFYANNNQIRIGSCIYLTNESTPLDYLISWDDNL